MSFDRAAYSAMVQRRRTTWAQNSRPMLETAMAASTRIDLLTGDPNWDHFLAYIEAAVLSMKERESGYARKLEDPMLVDPQEMMKIKVQLAQARARIEAWQAVQQLPKDILNLGAQAKSIMERLSEPAAA